MRALVKQSCGRCVTLTYSGLVKGRLGPFQKQVTPPVDQIDTFFSSLPRTCLLFPNSLPEGDLLDFYYRHSYAHINVSHILSFLSALKDIGLIIIPVFCHLGSTATLETDARPDWSILMLRRLC